MFLGEFEYAIDDRGRIAIPAKFRPALIEGLVVTRGLDRCLSIWPMSAWRDIAERFNQLPLMNADARRLHRLIFSGATDAEPDRLGRILIPSFLRTYAELSDTVVFVGLHDRIEVWGRANWETERAAAESQSAELAEHLFNLGV